MRLTRDFHGVWWTGGGVAIGFRLWTGLLVPK